MRNPGRDGSRLLAAAASAGVAVTIVELDVTDARSVSAAFDAAGPVELLVNNAAVANFGWVEETPIDDWEQTMATNYLGTVRCMQAALPSMRARRSGCIRAHATPPADIAATIVRVARDESSPFRVATGRAAAETIALRRELTDAAWRDVLGDPSFGATYRAPTST